MFLRSLSRKLLSRAVIRPQSPPHAPLAIEPLEDRVLLSSVEIVAAGFEGSESMQLLIDQQAVETWNVAGSDQGQELRSYFYETSDSVTADQIRVAFLNDQFDPTNGVDSNLRVDAIYVDGQRFETEAPDVFSTGTWLPADGVTPGFRQSEVLHSEGYFQFANTGTSATGSLIQIRARGDEGAETLQLQIDGQSVYTSTNVSTDFQTYTYRAEQAVGLDQVRVAFSNDQYISGTVDNNLVVDYVQIDGVIYQTESPNTLSTGTWLNGGAADGFWQSEQLNVDGYFAYGQGGQTSQIVIRAKGLDGTEDMQLLIGGAAVQTWQSVSTNYVDYQFDFDDAISIDQIRVAFLNSRWDPAAGIDSNLFVDHVSLNGVIYESEDPSVFSTGTWTPEDGIVPGFRQSEILHESGYLQYAATQLSFGSFALTTSFSIVAEDAGTAEVTVQRLEGADGSVSVDYQTFAITAEANVDFTSVSGTLVFADGELSRTVSIPILTDDSDEDAQTFSFVIENPQGGAGLLSPRTQTIEISDSGTAGQPGQYAPGTPELDLSTEVLASLQGAVGIDWTPDGSQMFVAEFGGFVYIYEDGQLGAQPFIDISGQVNGVRGLLDIAVHPDFENTPYIYLAFAYDPPEVYQNTGLAGPDGAGNRASRLIRVTADAANGYRTAVAGSEVVLLGTNSTWQHYNGTVDSTIDLNEPAGGYLPDGTNVRDFLAADSQSHTLNVVEFGPDGALYVGNGDGASYNSVDARGIRVQDIDNLSGKILRIDPITGQGLSDNPFFNGDAGANRSKVYQYGLRNPFRITFDATGQLYVGDVGWTQYEELNAGPAGANFGWPFYEGGDGQNLPTLQYSDLPEAIAFYNSNPNVTAPLVGMDHVGDQIDAIIVGDIYDGDTLPSEYQGTLIFNHLASGFVRAAVLDADGNVTAIRTLTQGPAFVTQIVTGPDGQLYFVNFGSGEIGRFVLA